MSLSRLSDVKSQTGNIMVINTRLANKININDIDYISTQETTG